jgi:signal transduction histidine kinase
LLLQKHKKLLYYIFPLIQIILILSVEYLDVSSGMQFIVLTVVAGIINEYSLFYAKIYSAAAFILYFAVNIAKEYVHYGTLNNDEVISYLYVNFLVFILVFAAFYTLKKQLITNKLLEEALKTLKEQSLQLEEMGAIAERNRIAGEIHDMVGHTLTTAVIAIEAGEKLIDRDEKAALEKFTLAKEQVRLGLNDIRSSVKAIQTEGDKAFITRLKSLLDDIRKNTDLKITEIVELKTELLPIQQNILLRVIKECTTNSLKHGRSTEADLLLQEYRDSVRLTFSDNGEGSENISFGFGLDNMQKLVQSIGGTLSAESIKGEGFTVNISVPTGIKTGGDKT